MNIITTRAQNWPQVVWNGFQFDWFQLDRVIPHRGYVYSCTYTLLKISGQPVENLMIGLATNEDGGHLSRYYVGRQVANQGGNCRLSCMLSTVSVAVIGLWAVHHTTRIRCTRLLLSSWRLRQLLLFALHSEGTIYGRSKMLQFIGTSEGRRTTKMKERTLIYTYILLVHHYSCQFMVHQSFFLQFLVSYYKL